MWKLGSRLLLLAIVVAALQLVLVPRLQKRKDVKRFEQVVAAKPDVLFFSDSVNSWIDDDDTDRRTLAEMLSDDLGANVGVIDRGAYHLEVYEAFIDLMIARGVRPQAILIPINLRSFSPEWHSRPAYQFTESKRELRQADDLLASAFQPALRTLQLLQDESITPDQFKRTPVYRGEQQVGHVRDFDNASFQTPTPERSREKFIYQYMYHLTDDHPKLVALRNICAKAKLHDFNVLIYVTPIDVASGEACLPGEFREQVARNIRTIAKQMKSHAPPLVDLSDALAPSEFSFELYANEHLKEGGRQFLAQHIGEKLHAAFDVGGEYSPVNDGPSPAVARRHDDDRQ